MKYLRVWILLLLIGLAGTVTAWAGETIAVVIGADHPLTSLSLDAVKLIYKGKSPLDGQGRRWIPLNLPATDPLRRAFSLALFQALPEEMEEYWNIQYFHGIAPPEVLASEEAVLRFIAMTPGAIGYLRESRADERVKTLLRLPVPPEQLPK